MAKLCAIDYLMDAFLYADIYLKWNRFGFEQYGENVTNLFQIRQRYRSGWLRLDLLSMVPSYYYGDFFYMSIARLPRLLKSPQLLELINEIESLIRERYMKGSTTMLSVFDLIKFLAFFLSAAHQIGSIYFLIGSVLTKHGLARASWMTVDPIILAKPDNIFVHYNRAIYWCLETFTVVCFGDVLARSPVETVFASLTCIIGWMCIGQVVGRITSLMASIDLDMKDHNERVDNFEQYARNRKLPQFLRERAIESIEYKSKSLIDLRMRSIFADLPQALHVILFEGLHGDFVRGVPEFAAVFANSQIRVLADALVLEIFVADDVIIEEGRLGTRLYIMKEGRAEQFSAQTRMVFAAVHKGVVSGDLAFFLLGTRHISSVRATKSCQVLRLDRLTWLTLWPDDVRHRLESKFVPMMRNKYDSVSRAFLNIFKNLELSIQAPPKLAGPPKSEARPGALASYAETGGSTRSLQSSNASWLGKLSRATGSENSDSVASGTSRPTSPSSKTLFKSFRGHVGSPMSLKKRKRSKKRSISSGGQHRKLSGVLGIAARNQHSERNIVVYGDAGWKRHEHNLRVLQFIDSRLHQGDKAKGIRTTHSGNFDKHEHTISSLTDSCASPVPSPDSKKGPTLDLTLVTSNEINFPPPNGESTRKSVAGSPGKGKRHSIQVNRAELTQAFRAIEESVKAAPTTLSQRTPTGPTASLPEVATNVAHESIISRALTSAAHTFHTRAHTTTDNTSAASSCSVASEGHDEPSTYVQHLDNLKKRSIRRHRRSVFDVMKDKEGDPSDDSENPYEIWLEPPLPPSFCLENSRFRRAWSAVMYAICLYYILVVPFRVSFDFDFLSNRNSNTLTTLWFAFEYTMDALCVVDFFLNKNFFAFVHRGTLMTDSHAIRDYYLRHGTYVVDLISILPLELLIPIMPFLDTVPGSNDRVTWYRVAVFRLNKMVRIVHLHSLGDKIQHILVYDIAPSLAFVRPSVIYFIRFAFDFALGAHWVACLFFAVAFNTLAPEVASWLTSAGMLTFGGVTDQADVGRVPLLTKYARSYHFSMGAITTVSYGDIAPQSAWETFVGTFVIVISIILFGMLSGGFSQVFEMELGKRADYEEKIASVAHFMKFHRFPARIWKHMQSYFLVHWKESEGMNEEELLDGLPPSVKNDITLYVKQDFVKQMKLFANCDEAFVRAVVVAFDQELYVRNDVIVSFGERGRRSLYVIESGHVLVRVPKKLTEKPKEPMTASSDADAAPDPTSDSRGGTRLTFSQGADLEIMKGRFDFFGEKSLIFDLPRSATCVALSTCSMLILTLEKYEEILLEFPEYREKNMHEWVIANTRENTPASAIRTPSVLAAMRSKMTTRAHAAAPSHSIDLSTSEAGDKAPSPLPRHSTPPLGPTLP